jgi:small-conductance mechanosensitive channel
MQSDRFRAARPFFMRAAIAVIVATSGFVWANALGQIKKKPIDQVVTTSERLIAIGGALIVLIAGVIAVRAIAGGVRAAMYDEREKDRGASLAFILSGLGYAFVLLGVLGALNVGVEKVLLGGALTGVILGIAAQQSLGNFFAGIVLLIVRPFSIGEHIVLKSGPIGGEYEGTVTEMTMYYVHLDTPRGPVQLPNAGVLASAIGPGARTPDDGDEGDEDTGTESDPGPALGGTPAG